MKFALNGALTIGTLDGANIEIAEQVGAGQHLHLRQPHRAGGRHPRPRLPAARSYYEANPDLKYALDQHPRRRCSRADEPGRYQQIVRRCWYFGDHYLLLADYASYVEAQDKVDALYREPTPGRDGDPECGGHGRVLVGPHIAEYAHEIWKTRPVALGPAAEAAHGFFGGVSVTKPMRFRPALLRRCPSPRPPGRRARLWSARSWISVSRLSAGGLGQPRRPVRRCSPAGRSGRPCPPRPPPASRTCGASLGWPASVRGRSSRIELASSGAVMMKITSSTSITSTSGVTLMSPAAAGRRRRSSCRR